MATMPVDVKAVLEEALNLKNASSTPVSVSVYLDDRSPEDVAAVVRNAFASAASHARITLSYLGSMQAVPNAADDLAVIVAGLNDGVGKLASDLRSAGVPVMVVTSLPEYVSNLATQQGYPIPEGDVVAPVELTMQDSRAAQYAEQFQSGVAQKMRSNQAQAEDGPIEVQPVAVDDATDASSDSHASAVKDIAEELVADVITETQQGRGVGKLFNNFVSRAQAKVAAVQEAAVASQGQSSAEQSVADAIAAAVPEGSPEPYEMTDEATALLHKRMGEWIIQTCSQKKLALALAFPFVRKPLSLEAVNMTSVQNAGIGAVMFIPGADLPVMTLNQAKMLLQIAAAYGQPMTLERAKELVAVVAGGLACRTAARELVGLVPAAGFLIKGAIGYSGTLAMGRTAIEYFEGGGGAAGLAGVVGKVSSTAAGVVSKAQSTLNQEEEPVVDDRTASQKAADTAKDWSSRFGKAASAMASAAGPLAQAAAKTGLESFASGSSSVASSVSKLIKRS